ncbi:TPA_exp: Uncharacterized protein A8136_1636 [Trichophyton benhamiae CBS 112371]|uniref:Integral membrane protein n=1 Tax=Arthroderma benhamiae (strain ATCC MYA-4681 / CBS 112371) TaxID=663331 RepID=D4AWT6_ARTBC|nr:uncharacterized protein ARB_00652 [Trichophyton benhamiae CBS 112371]EFE32467.1 hypothetical protein ARB_00652 [Trichophyton benhamiae CBS 112371]DAA75562.1 TPA_exp: Uncharacterized protein A8136_1636 [Trichophyton benhamiae CBS 112371]
MIRHTRPGRELWVSISLYALCILLLVEGSRAAPTSTLPAAGAKLEPRGIFGPNETAAEDDSVLCVFPISGQYGFLSRLLYYGSLVFAIIGRTHRWLVLGALASALAFAGSTSIHMLTLVTSKTPAFDLDILAAWSILTTGCLAFAALIHWSSSVRNSDSRVVLILWGMMVGIGCVTGRALLLDVNSQAEPACRSSNGTLLKAQSELASGMFNCTYKCFGVRTPLRDPSEITVMPAKVFVGTYSTLTVALMAPILAAAHKSMSVNLSLHSPSDLCAHWVLGYLNHSLNARLSQHIYNAACSTWYGGYILLLRYASTAKFKSNKRRLIAITLICPLLVIDLVLDILTPFIFIANILINEINLMINHFPVEEGIRSIGQWSPMVSAALVILAAIINQLTERHRILKEKKKAAKSSDPHSGLPVWSHSQTCESQTSASPLVYDHRTRHGDTDRKPGHHHHAQEIGVIERDFSRQETLHTELEDYPKHSPKAYIRP